MHRAVWAFLMNAHLTREEYHKNKYFTGEPAVQDALNLSISVSRLDRRNIKENWKITIQIMKNMLILKKLGIMKFIKNHSDKFSARSEQYSRKSENLKK